MKSTPKPPRTFDQFSERFPKIREAWDLLGDAGEEGPLTPRERRLVKLGVAIGATREGAVHSSARKGIAMGLTPRELEQVVALAGSVTGLPSAVAAWTWIRDVFEKKD